MKKYLHKPLQSKITDIKHTALTQPVQVNTNKPVGAAYLAPRGYEDVLEAELAHRGLTVLFRHGRLFATAEAPRSVAFAQNVWLNPEYIAVRSIKEAASALRAVQRNWALYSAGFHRRAALIQEALPPVSAKPLAFGAPLPSSPLGSWTLLGPELLLASPRSSSPFPHGEAHFIEDKETPPNRAYLKLWELFTLIGTRPGHGDLCIDLGGSPGGWSWVLAELGAHVFAIDKAPLAPHIARHPRIESCIGSAFALTPAVTEGVSWIVSDVACYPDRLLALMRSLAETDAGVNLVATIKLSGKTDFSALDSFSSIPGSRSVHLFANKHEVTWIRLVK